MENYSENQENLYFFQKSSTLEKAVTEREYRELLYCVSDATLFNDWPWLTVTERYSNADSHLFITCRGKDDNLLIAFIALAVKTEKMYHLTLKVVRLLQFPYGDRIGMLIHPDHLEVWEPFLAVLAEEQSLSSWDLLLWDEWTESQGLLEKTRKWAVTRGQAIQIKETCKCPVVVTEGVSKEELLGPLRKKRKIGLRRCRKRLAEYSHERVHYRPPVDQVEGLLADIAGTELASWKGDRNLGLFSNPECSEFFKEVSLALAQNDQLFISLLYIDQELASYRYGYLFRNIFLDYSIAYLPQYRSLSLGAILLDELISVAIDRGYKAVDASRVGLDSNNLIKEWANFTVAHYRLYWFGGTVRGRLVQFLTTRVKALAKKIRGSYRRWRVPEEYNEMLRQKED